MKHELATLGAGCFWCVEAIFSSLKGVISATSGYSGGSAESANYKTVCEGNTTHAEVVHICFDPDQISFKAILDVFWQCHNPTTLNRQGDDVGSQYRSIIFTHSEQQLKIAEDMIAKLSKANMWDEPIVTELTPFEQFYPAESYHENYFALNGEQPYCQMVVKPKVDKFKQLFADKLK